MISAFYTEEKNRDEDAEKYRQSGYNVGTWEIPHPVKAGRTLYTLVAKKEGVKVRQEGLFQ